MNLNSKGHLFTVIMEITEILSGVGENRTLIYWLQTSRPPIERRPHNLNI